MADVRALTGVRYDPARAGGLDQLVCPPYDVIPGADLPLYKARSPHNFVHLTRPGDDYFGAAQTLQTWIQEGILRADPLPALYLHEVRFDKRVRRDLIAAVRLQPYSDGVILPHELTHPGPKEDRLALLRATSAALEPLWFLYQGSGSPLPALLARAEAGANEHLARFETAEGSHRLWAVRDGALLKEIEQAFAPLPLLIADGHHRYETSLAYSQELGGSSDASSRFTLALLTDIDDPGLVVLPTHRVLKAGVKVTGGTPSASLKATLEAIEGGVAAGCYQEGAFQVLGLEGEVAVLELHRQVIDNILGRRPAEEYLAYTRDAAEAVRWVDQGQGIAAFLLAAPRLGQVLKLAQEGITMPQKSTYFYPKPPSGMLLLRLDPQRQL